MTRTCSAQQAGGTCGTGLALSTSRAEACLAIGGWSDEGTRKNAAGRERTEEALRAVFTSSEPCRTGRDRTSWLRPSGVRERALVNVGAPKAKDDGGGHALYTLPLSGVLAKGDALWTVTNGIPCAIGLTLLLGE